MRLIDADEVMEHVYRDKLDTRELIAKMIENAPTITEYDQLQEENGELKRHIEYLKSKINSQNAEIRALAFAIRCNSVSGNEVKYD